MRPVKGRWLKRPRCSFAASAAAPTAPAGKIRRTIKVSRVANPPLVDQRRKGSMRVVGAAVRSHIINSARMTANAIRRTGASWDRKVVSAIVTVILHPVPCGYLPCVTLRETASISRFKYHEFRLTLPGGFNEQERRRGPALARQAFEDCILPRHPGDCS